MFFTIIFFLLCIFSIILSISLTGQEVIFVIIHSENCSNVSYVMLFSIASYCNFRDIKLKKLSMGLMSGLFAVILICLIPYDSTTFQAALQFWLGSPSTFTKHFWKFIFHKFCKTFPIHAFILMMNRGNKSSNWNDKFDLEV